MKLLFSCPLDVAFLRPPPSFALLRVNEFDPDAPRVGSARARGRFPRSIIELALLPAGSVRSAHSASVRSKMIYCMNICAIVETASTVVNRS